MKTSLLLRTLLLASALAGTAVHAADAVPATPDIESLMALLNRLAAEAGVEAEPAAAASADAAPTVSKPASSNLRMSSLTPSAALGGRGATPAARAPESDWRALFPLKAPRN